MSLIEILSPVAATRVATRPLAPRLATLTAKRIGWLDNMKANAGELLRAVERELRAAGHDFVSSTAAKNATAAAPEAVMTHLKTCDAVVLAIAD